MRSGLSLALALVGSIAAVAACSGGSTTTEEPVATATATADTPPTATATAEPTTQPTAEPTSQPTSAPTTQPTSAPTTQPTSQPTAKAKWKDLTHDQKLAVMKDEVMPQMTKAFQGFDAKKFATFNCASCHGKNAKQANFKMPNAELPKLNPDNNFAAHQAKAQMLQFMFSMTPQMASILNAEPWDPAKKAGFGCFSCHTAAKK